MLRRVLLLVTVVTLFTSTLVVVYLSFWQEPRLVKTNVAAYSNIHPADYVGPDACATCHEAPYQQWQGHSHSRMNRNASDESVVGDFSGQKIEYGAGYVVFERNGDNFLMSLYEGASLTRQYRVTRTVGSRIEQMYIGVQTRGPEPDGHPIYRLEGKLPFGYWIKRKIWLPDAYFDSDRPAEPTNEEQMSASLIDVHKTIHWEQTCLYCHNTYAYQHRVFFGEGLGFRPQQIEILGSSAMVQSWGPAKPDKLVVLGVSCESCHFGGREHAVARRESRYLPSSPKLRVRADIKGESARTPSVSVVNSICSQCHCARISRYPNGAGTWNSREALDLTASACSSQLKCTDCHDPHRSRHDGGMLDESQVSETCLRCHEKYRESAPRAAHTRHAASTNVSCLDCHMPKIVQGLEEVVRSHLISSPTDVKMLQVAAPNACNLCHLDQPVTWTLAELKSGWGREIAADETWNREHQGDLTQPLGTVWLKHRMPVIRLIAAPAYADSPQAKVELPRLLPSLLDPVAVNRMFGLFAVEQVLGRQLTDDEYAPLANSERRERQVKQLLRQASGEVRPAASD